MNWPATRLVPQVANTPHLVNWLKTPHSQQSRDTTDSSGHPDKNDKNDSLSVLSGKREHTGLWSTQPLLLDRVTLFRGHKDNPCPPPGSSEVAPGLENHHQIFQNSRLSATIHITTDVQLSQRECCKNSTTGATRESHNHTDAACIQKIE